MKQYFNELSSARQSELLLATESLFDEVVEDMVETETFYLQDQLEPFEKTVVYEYGFYCQGWVRMNNKELSNIREFVSGLIDSTEAYGTLNDEMLQFAKELYDKTDMLYDMEHDNKQYENLENHICGEVDILLKALSKHLTETFEYIEDGENVVSYFHEFYKEERMNMEEYHFDTDTEKLYKTSVYELV